MKPLLFIFLFLSTTTLAQDYLSYDEMYNPYMLRGQWGYMTVYGSSHISPQYEEAFPFSEGLALVKKNGKYGFIDRHGVLMIEYTYDNAKSFSNRYAWVRKNGQEALIDHKGIPLMGYWFTRIGPFQNGYARVVFKNDSISTLLNDKFIVAYINKNGKQLASRWFSGGTNFENGKAKVYISGECYYIDTVGRIEAAICDECDETALFDPNYRPDKDAQFPGGDLAISKYINKHLEYPLDAIKKGRQGIVFVKYTINKHGRVVKAEIEKGATPTLNIAALKVVRQLPEFEPAIKDGKPVCTWQIVPIYFLLE